MRTNVIQFLAIVASVFIVLSLLKMLSDSTDPVQNVGEVRANFTDVPSDNNQPSGYVSESYSAPVEEQEQPQEDFVAAEPEVASSGGNCFPKDSLTAKDLLPSDDASNKWAQVNPVGKGDIQDQNFVVAGHHIGVNTVGQSLRNANRQLRSEPANPQVKVSPWNQATIDPDVNRKALEIGGC
jgi:hypothetical protein